MSDKQPWLFHMAVRDLHARFSAISPFHMGDRIPDAVKAKVLTFKIKETDLLRRAAKCRDNLDFEGWNRLTDEAAEMDFRLTDYWKYRCSCGGPLDHTH